MNPETFFPAVHALGGAITGSVLRSAFVKVDNGNEEAVRKALLSIDGIIEVVLNGVAYTSIARPLSRSATAGIPIASGTGKSGDGVINVAPGATVSISSVLNPSVLVQTNAVGQTMARVATRK